MANKGASSIYMCDLSGSHYIIVMIVTNIILIYILRYIQALSFLKQKLQYKHSHSVVLHATRDEDIRYVVRCSRGTKMAFHIE